MKETKFLQLLMNYSNKCVSLLREERRPDSKAGGNRIIGLIPCTKLSTRAEKER